MVYDRFRMRAKSRDSGIDVRFRNARMSPGDDRRIFSQEDCSMEKWDIDTVLWTVVFVMMVWCFRLPVSIWFSPKVDWPIAMLSVPFFTIFGFCGLCMYVKHCSTSRWFARSPYIFTVAWTAFFLWCSQFLYLDVVIVWMVVALYCRCNFNVPHFDCTFILVVVLPY
ncbi:hypothetical protein KIN20_004659 [Parelaphostrongylus tenuis]|nr:hypothetical protein KIN20_004659 [Parelaphostrongylus tenuis]